MHMIFTLTYIRLSTCNFQSCGETESTRRFEVSSWFGIEKLEVRNIYGQ